MFWFIVFGIATFLAGTGVLGLTVGMFQEAHRAKDIVDLFMGFLFSAVTFIVYALAYWLVFIAPHIEW